MVWDFTSELPPVKINNRKRIAVQDEPVRETFENKVIRDLSTRIELVNTREFSRDAQNFLKYGYYTEYPKKTLPNKEYWQEQTKRALEGYSVGGIKITGDHYMYLNFCPITKIPDSILLGPKDRGVLNAEKIEEFPFFFYGDYEFYNELENARLNGLHFLCLKARGTGFSYKNAELLIRDFFLIRKSKGFAFASEKEYLTRDGILNKAWNYIDFINTNTSWYKSMDYKNTVDHKKASFKKTMPNGVQVESGYKSEIMGVTLKNNPDRARGKRGRRIVWEEFGNLPHGKKAWQIARPSVEQGGYTTGQMIAFGTGGEEGAAFEAMEEMFYSPEAYNIQPFYNHWEKEIGGVTAYFFPQYYNKDRYTDEHGNHDVEAAIEADKKEREIKKKATDPNALIRHVAEHPNTPSEAILSSSINIFPTDAIKAWRSYLIANKIPNKILKHGKIINIKGQFEFEITESVTPLAYPVDPDKDTSGCVTILETPFKTEKEGKLEVPKGLYYAWHDPYAFDKTKKVTSQTSMGATYIFKTDNNISYTGNLLVAWYIGRPASQNDYNMNMFNLVQYYNAELAIENDRGGEVIAYAKDKKLLNCMAPEFRLLKNEGNNKIINHLGRGFGISMSNDLIKGQAEIYLRDFLIQQNHTDENGNLILNLHKIYDINLLQELVRYDRNNGNFDRVSAMLVGMYHRRENYAKETKKATEEKSTIEEGVFSRAWF